MPTDLARCDSARGFLQSGFWGSFKARFGWNARAFSVDWGEAGQCPLLVIRRRLAPGISFAYVPLGPEI
ncbi:MAG: peptidoglycan bridge formation protein FemAB, partial [Termitinemataceae bacterium]